MNEWMTVFFYDCLQIEYFYASWPFLSKCGKYPKIFFYPHLHLYNIFEHTFGTLISELILNQKIIPKSSHIIFADDCRWK